MKHVAFQFVSNMDVNQQMVRSHQESYELLISLGGPVWTYV